MDQGDQVIQPPAPGLLAEQAERHVGDVHRRDRPALRRGQQRAAGRPAGQVGDRPGRQLQGQRGGGQRMRGKRGGEPGPVPRVPARPGPGAPPARSPPSSTLRRLVPPPAPSGRARRAGPVQRGRAAGRPTGPGDGAGRKFHGGRHARAALTCDGVRRPRAYFAGGPAPGDRDGAIARTPGGGHDPSVRTLAAAPAGPVQGAGRRDRAGCCVTLLAAQFPAGAIAVSGTPSPVTGNARGSAAWGGPYGGCGLPQANLDSQDFLALNVQNSPGVYTNLPRPIPAADACEIGMFDNGLNCGRWVQVTIGNYCTGINDGAQDEPFCRNGSWISPTSTTARHWTSWSRQLR